MWHVPPQALWGRLWTGFPRVRGILRPVPDPQAIKGKMKGTGWSSPAPAPVPYSSGKSQLKPDLVTEVAFQGQSGQSSSFSMSHPTIFI